MLQDYHHQFYRLQVGAVVVQTFRLSVSQHKQDAHPTRILRSEKPIPLLISRTHRKCIVRCDTLTPSFQVGVDEDSILKQQASIRLVARHTHPFSAIFRFGDKLAGK